MFWYQTFVLLLLAAGRHIQIVKMYEDNDPCVDMDWEYTSPESTRVEEPNQESVLDLIYRSVQNHRIYQEMAWSHSTNGKYAFRYDNYTLSQDFFSRVLSFECI